MTSYKPYNPYNPNKDTRPSIVSIGCEIATRAQEEYEYGHLIPIKTQIVFLDVPRDVVFTKKGGCDYNHIAAYFSTDQRSQMGSIRQLPSSKGNCYTRQESKLL